MDLLKKNFVASKKKGNELSFTFSDILGSVEINSLKIISIRPIDSATALVSNVILEDKRSYIFNRHVPGRYLVKFSVEFTIDGFGHTLTGENVFSITAKANFKGMKVYFGVNTEKTLNIERLKIIESQNTLSEAVASADANDVVHIAFSLPSTIKVSLQQLSISLVGIDSKVDATFFPTKLTEKSAYFQTSIVLSSSAKKFSFTSGEYQISILIADSLHISRPIQWILGKLTVSVPSKPIKVLLYYDRFSNL
jgi:hypothetical protein